MNEYELLADIIRTIAWPATVIFLFSQLRGPLTRLLFRMSKFKSFGAEIEFEELMERVGERIAQQTHVAPLTDCQKKRMKDAIASLETNSRVFVFLYYYEEFSTQKIAEILGLDVPRVNELHSSILSKLKAVIQE